ncbi:WxL protein peptidoglycan domain-containing protein [Streptomyces sp. KLOTTS4A1]|uniref:WxL protein peptidoglycan domain-containing protein n=1 Tax=Streptomyces sp. KLOTTS4A1 TaxID=3390996 RepID=UPI0039F44752
MPRPYAWIVAAVAGLLLALTGPPQDARAAENGTWAVFPTPPAGSDTRGREYFAHAADPGAEIEDSVTVANTSDKELTFRVFATDAMNTPRGGAFALLPVQQEPKDVGTWIELGAEDAARDTTITVRPHQRVDIPFRLKVPDDASPGDHIGGIVALNTEVESVREEDNVRVGVQRSVGARMYLRVNGPEAPALLVESVSVERSAPLLPWTSDAKATVRYVLVNHGNVRIRPTVQLTAEGLFGRDVLTQRPRALKTELLPGQRVELTEPWASTPQFDRVTLKVTAGAFDRPEVPKATARTSFLALPWPALLALLGLLLLVWATRRVRRAGGPRAAWRRLRTRLRARLRRTPRAPNSRDTDEEWTSAAPPSLTR